MDEAYGEVDTGDDNTFVFLIWKTPTDTTSHTTPPLPTKKKKERSCKIATRNRIIVDVDHYFQWQWLSLPT